MLNSFENKFWQVGLKIYISGECSEGVWKESALCEEGSGECKES